MNYFNSIKQNDALKEALYEIPASIFFVIFYSFLIGPIIGPEGTAIKLLIGAALFALVYFIETNVFFPKVDVHIIPIISYIESLRRNDISIFLYRLPGQFAGAVLAILMIWTTIAPESKSLYSFEYFQLDPFLTALFTGFIAQFAYLLHFFVMVRMKIASSVLRFFIFSAGLGVLFFIVTQFGKITLLNPFGFLAISILNGHQGHIQTIFLGVVIHIVVPMVFISGTHFFLNRVDRIIEIND
ncbi:MAG TPA: hypothetical protein DER09_03870 [Prolixibacteraceae bacterium]|nr:hypothetical protein [Prolixibacteraceae bacterium]